MINQQDKYGRTPLHDACASGKPESVHLLLEAGAAFAIIDKNKRTPLHACAEFPNEQRLWNLLSHPDEVSGQVLQDRFRPTAKKERSFHQWYKVTWPTPDVKPKDRLSTRLIVKSLLSAGSDVLAFDHRQQTPLDLALEYDCREMIQALECSSVLLREKRMFKSEDQRLSTFLALKMLEDSPVSRLHRHHRASEQIFQNVSTYMPILSNDDLEWMAQNGANITGFDDSKPIQTSGQSLLHIATANGMVELVESFGKLARINDDPKIVLARIHAQLAVDPKYNPGLENLAPALHVACAREVPNMNLVKVLVDKCGVDINAHAVTEPRRWAKVAESVEGGTALHVLARAQYWWQLKALKFLLQNGADLEAVNEKGETPLHIACTGTTFKAMNGEGGGYGYWRIEAVNMLIEYGADIHFLDSDGLSCLHKSSSSPQIMKILLKHGADINGGKFSPVFSAIQIQCLETLTILLDAGVSPNVVDPNVGNKGFQLSYKVKKDSIRSALLCASFANLHNQQAKDSVPMVKLLIERGADIYAALNEKETLIHYIFEHAEFEIICAFINSSTKANMDFNTRDSLGRTIFIASCEWKECLPGYQYKHWYPKETATFIRTLEFGANPLLVDDEGRNALHHLLDNPKTEEDSIIQFLAHDAAKTLLHQKDANGFTPLNCALRFLRPAVVEVMVTMGQDLLSPDPTGATALHRIAEQCIGGKTRGRSGSYGTDQLDKYHTTALALWKNFLALGGSINVRDNKGAPPLFYFLSSAERDQQLNPEQCCHLDYFATYFSAGVAPDFDIAAKNENGESALHVVARRDKKKVHGRQEHEHVPTHDKELYQFFVRKGLNPLEEDDHGRTSLDVAAACEQKGILELFQYTK